MLISQSDGARTVRKTASCTPGPANGQGFEEPGGQRHRPALPAPLRRQGLVTCGESRDDFLLSTLMMESGGLPMWIIVIIGES